MYSKSQRKRLGVGWRDLILKTLNNKGGFLKMKIYSDDPIVPYKKTQVDPRTTKEEIEGLLARWGIKKSGWDWDLENGRCILEFQYFEFINNIPVSQWVKVEPPIIWKRKSTKAHWQSRGHNQLER